MTNEELKKKIIDIIHDTEICSVENNCDTCKYGKELMNYKDTSCRTLRAADNLIAAVIGDVKDLQAQVDSLEITNIALQAGYDDAEEDRLYWVDKYKEAERRAEKYERALELMARGECTFASPEYYLNQAEKELAEEGKDET